jgi:lipid-A-disaccharide synthase
LVIAPMNDRELSNGLSPKVLMVAGEVSGDLQGAYLARALMGLCPDLELIGAGGEQMRAAGVDLRFETTQFASVGLLEPLRYLWPLRKLLGRIQALIDAEKPRLVILIDHHGFNMALARHLRRRGVPVVYYFPPQIWTGSSLFAGSVARRTQLIISAFKREAQIYAQYGGRAVYLGHPLLDIVKPGENPELVLGTLGLSDQRPLIAVMPGSRHQEIEHLARPMFGAARIIQDRYPNARFILPLAAQHLRPALQREMERAGVTRLFRIITKDVYTCLSQCSAVLTTSGTSTLEAALLGVPMVVAYRVSELSAWLARRFAITQFIAMPNILLNERVVPEIFQENVTQERLAAAALEILGSPSQTARVKARLQEVRTMLGSEGVIERVAARILEEAAVPQLPNLAEAAR